MDILVELEKRKVKLDLSPATLEVYNIVSNPKDNFARLTGKDVHVIKTHIMPQLEKDTQTANAFIGTLLDNWGGGGDLLDSIFTDTEILNNLILNNIDTLSERILRILANKSEDYSVNSEATHRLVEYLLQEPEKWMNWMPYRLGIMLASNPHYDEKLKQKLVSSFKASQRSEIPYIFSFLEEYPEYLPEQYNKFKSHFEKFMGVSFQYKETIRNPQKISYSFNTSFKTWAIKYIQGFYYTEVMVNEIEAAHNHIFALILACNSRVPKEIREHAKESLSRPRYYKISPHYLLSIEKEKWVDNLEEFYDLVLFEDNIQKYLELKNEPTIKDWFIIKKFQRPMLRVPELWKNFPPEWEYYFEFKNYKEFYNEEELKQLKTNIINFLKESYTWDIDPESCSLEIAASILETYLLETESQIIQFLK